VFLFLLLSVFGWRLRSPVSWRWRRTPGGRGSSRRQTIKAAAASLRTLAGYLLLPRGAALRARVAVWSSLRRRLLSRGAAVTRRMALWFVGAANCFSLHACLCTLPTCSACLPVPFSPSLPASWHCQKLLGGLACASRSLAAGGDSAHLPSSPASLSSSRGAFLSSAFLARPGSGHETLRSGEEQAGACTLLLGAARRFSPPRLSLRAFTLPFSLLTACSLAYSIARNGVTTCGAASSTCTWWQRSASWRHGSRCV